MNFETMISTITGVIIGGLITWLVSRFYYVKAGEIAHIRVSKAQINF